MRKALKRPRVRKAPSGAARVPLLLLAPPRSASHTKHARSGPSMSRSVQGGVPEAIRSVAGYRSVVGSPRNIEYRPMGQNPWWIPPFLGGVPAGLSPEHLRLLGVLSFAMFFENYDHSLLGNALPQLARTFGLSKGALGDFTSITRLGALPAFLFVPLADRIGRRRVVLLSVIGMSLGSVLTATSQSALQFVLYQFVTRTFLIAAGVVAVVILTEEFPAKHRGWGIGMLSGVAAIGFGVGALLYGLVNRLPLGWRALYALAGSPIVLLPWLRRGIVETRRFQRARAALHDREGIGVALGGILRPLTGLLREQPRRALAIGLIGAMSSAGIAVSFQFISEFLQTLRGWTPGRFALMSFFFGALGIIGNPVAGRMADRFGRRRVIVVALLAFPALVATFYAGPARFVAIPWTAMVFTNMASGVMLRALATELFPTAFRGAAGGTLALLETLGAVAWLFLYSRAMDRIGNQQLVIPLLSLATIVAAGAVFFVPETARRELEQISDEGASRTE
jgi:MFS family permease